MPRWFKRTLLIMVLCWLIAFRVLLSASEERKVAQQQQAQELLKQARPQAATMTTYSPELGLLIWTLTPVIDSNGNVIILNAVCYQGKKILLKKSFYSEEIVDEMVDDAIRDFIASQ